MNWIIQNSDYSNKSFYDVISEQLELIYDNIIQSESRIGVQLIIDYYLDNLVMIKKIISGSAYF